VALPGKARNIRAFSATMLLVDEAARVEDEVYDDLRGLRQGEGVLRWIGPFHSTRFA
jgi:hypothetical protein